MEICSRLNVSGQLNEVTLQDIKALRSHGIDLTDIKKAIQKATGTGMDELNRVLDDTVQRNQQYYSEAIDIAGLTQPDTLVEAADIAAIMEQCQREYGNITRSMGFLVDNGRTMLEPAKGYQWALDNAAIQVQSGAVGYEQAIKSAVQQLADSGLKTVNYESGHVDSVDVAVRRAVMTGVNQLNRKYTEQSMDYLETDLVEVSAHYGARNVDGSNGWENHERWQGGIYRWAAFHRRYPNASAGDYKDFEQICGYGDVTGILGANCRHTYSCFVEGVMEPTYSQADLDRMKAENNLVTYDGKTYDGYQATQMQRRLERTIRKQKRLVNAYKAAGLKEDAQTANIKLRRLENKYTQFSKAANLPEYTERKNVLYQTDRVAAGQSKVAQRGTYSTRETPTMTSPVASTTESAIIGEKTSRGGVGVQNIGKIDLDKYRVVAENIRTDEVVITEERIQHIQEHHPNDYERFVSYIPQIVADPDYIIEANKEHTAVILKEVSAGNTEKFKLILRLSVPQDPDGYKNSIISFWKIGETTWRKIIKNKKILYKRE